LDAACVGVVRQALAAGVIDELTLDGAPVLLGPGERMLDGLEGFGFEPDVLSHSRFGGSDSVAGCAQRSPPASGQLVSSDA
jgi:dihydrofolate reductase